MLINIKSCNARFTYATGMYQQLSRISSEIQIFNFEYLTSGHYIYVRKGVRIRRYFSKQKAVREQECLGKTALAYPHIRYFDSGASWTHPRSYLFVCALSHIPPHPCPLSRWKTWRPWAPSEHMTIEVKNLGCILGRERLQLLFSYRFNSLPNSNFRIISTVATISVLESFQ